MRIIHIRFKNKNSLKTSIRKIGSEIRLTIINSHYSSLVLERPTLKRRLVGGPVFIEHWGDKEKWFGDDVSSTRGW